MLFHEKISLRLRVAIGLITLSSALLSIEGEGSLQFSAESAFVLPARVCRGLENNCMRMLSTSGPQQIVIVNGVGSGLGSLVIALCLSERLSSAGAVLPALLPGFVAYGLSIYFYVYAQRTSACYAGAPFIGVLLSRPLPGTARSAVLCCAGHHDCRNGAFGQGRRRAEKLISSQTNKKAHGARLFPPCTGRFLLHQGQMATLITLSRRCSKRA